MKTDSSQSRFMNYNSEKKTKGMNFKNYLVSVTFLMHKTIYSMILNTKVITLHRVPNKRD